MTYRELVEREIHVALYAQSTRFRIIKYIVLFIFGLGLYLWQGTQVLIETFLVLTVIAIGIHFFFRWKTNGWMKSWGPYETLFSKDK